jgi:O-antigen/teichoic acid export membrane protein
MALSAVVAWVTGTVAAGALWLAAPWLAEHTLAARNLASALRISCLLVLLGGVNGAQTGALSGFESFKTIAWVNLLAGVASFPLTVAGAWYAGVEGAVWGLVASLAVSALLNNLALRKESAKASVPVFHSGWRDEWNVLWQFSLPAVLAGVMATPATWLASAILVNQPQGYAEMGLYNAVSRIKQIPELLLTTMLAPMLPLLAGQFRRNKPEECAQTIRYAYIISLVLMVPLAAVQIAVPSLTTLPYGTQFAGGQGVVQWLMIHSLLVGLFTPLGAVLPGMGKMWLGFIYNLLWGSVYLALAYWLVPRYSAIGLAMAYALAHLVSCSVVVAYVGRVSPAILRSVPLFKLTLILGLVSLACLLLANAVKPLVAGMSAIILVGLFFFLIHKRKYLRLADQTN